MAVLQQADLTPSAAIKNFWLWFEAHAPAFNTILENGDNIEQSIFVPLAEHLRTLDADIFFLLGYKKDQAAELILTADGNVKNMFLIDELVALAPEVPDWKFVAHKQSMDLDHLRITIGGFDFNKDTIFFRPVVHEDFPDLIDMEVIYKKYDAEQITTINQGIFIFLDNYLGEVNFVKNIDNIRIVAAVEDEAEVVPIYKLKNYLIWREKEFIEKYNETTSAIAEESYTVLSAQLPDEQSMIAVINTKVLNWDAKASHPWIGVFAITYESSLHDGFPDEVVLQSLEQLEQDLLDNLPLERGFIHIGRQTSGGVREIFFTTKDYDMLARVFYRIKDLYTNEFEINTDIYKDKYWRTFDKYRVDESL